MRSCLHKRMVWSGLSHLPWAVRWVGLVQHIGSLGHHLAQNLQNMHQIRLKIEFRESEARGSSIMTLKAQANLMKKDLNSLLTRMIYYWHRYQVLLTPYFHQIWVMKDQT